MCFPIAPVYKYLTAAFTTNNNATKNLREQKVKMTIASRWKAFVPWEAEELACFYHAFFKHGCCWKSLAASLAGRTEEMVQMVYEQAELILRLPASVNNLVSFQECIEKFQRTRVYVDSRAPVDSKGKAPLVVSEDEEEADGYFSDSMRSMRSEVAVFEDDPTLDQISETDAVFEYDPILDQISDSEGVEFDERYAGAPLESFEFSFVEAGTEDKRVSGLVSSDSENTNGVTVDGRSIIRNFEDDPTLDQISETDAVFEYDPILDQISDSEGVEFDERYAGAPLESFEFSFVEAGTEDKRVSRLVSSDSENTNGVTVDGSSKIRNWKNVVPWTPEELEIFYSAYESLGVDFELIAARLPNRTSDMVKMLYDISESYLIKPSNERTLDGFKLTVDSFHRQVLYCYESGDELAFPGEVGLFASDSAEVKVEADSDCGKMYGQSSSNNICRDGVDSDSDKVAGGECGKILGKSEESEI